jgi:hypothetical protein
LNRNRDERKNNFGRFSRLSDPIFSKNQPIKSDSCPRHPRKTTQARLSAQNGTSREKCGLTSCLYGAASGACRGDLTKRVERAELPRQALSRPSLPLPACRVEAARRPGWALREAAHRRARPGTARTQAEPVNPYPRESSPLFAHLLQRQGFRAADIFGFRNYRGGGNLIAILQAD